MSDRYQTTAPDFSAPLVHRERLTSDLEAHLDRRLILVIAPAGYGKTTFLADFTHSTNVPVCWVRLTPEEQDPTQLGNLIWESLTKRFRRLKKLSTLDENHSGESSYSPPFIRQAIQENIPEKHVLIFDEFNQLSGSNQAIAFLDKLLKEIPTQSTLIIAGRFLPELSISRFVAGNQIKHFGYVDLSLDLTELKSVVMKRNGEIPEIDTALQLLGETEGWVTGVVLSSLIQNELCPPKRNTSLVDDYFREVESSNLTINQKNFLLQTSILPVLTIDLCNHILEIENSDSIIEEILDLGTFLHIVRNFPEKMFKYQRQYANFLMSKIDFESNWISGISNRAINWYTENGFPELAFSLSITVGNFETAFQIAKNSSSYEFSRANVKRLKTWARCLSKNGYEIPDIYRQIAFIEAYQGNLDTASELYTKALGLLDENSDPNVLMRILDGEFLIERDFGFGKDVRELLGTMESLLPEVSKNERARYYVSLMEYQLGYLKDLDSSLETFSKVRSHADPQILQRGLNDKGKALGLLGYLMEAYQAFEEAYQICIDHQIDQGKAIALINIGTTAHYLGRYFEAHARYQQSLSAAIESRNNHNIPWVLMSIGDLLTDLGFFVSAENHYREALSNTQDWTESEIFGLIRIGLSKCLRSQGDRKSAKRIIGGIENSKNDWHFNTLLSIEKSYEKYHSSPEERLGYLLEISQNAAHTVVGQLVLDIEKVKCHIETKELAQATSNLEEILSFVGSRRLYHFLAAEIWNHEEMLSILKDINASQADMAMRYVNEIMRVRTRFQLIGNDFSYGGEKYKTLGKVDIRGLDGRRVDLRPIHIETLIFLLDNENTSTDEITDHLWRDLSPEKQASNVHAAVYQIRRSLGSTFVSKSGGYYRVNKSRINHFDVKAFEMAASRTLNHLGVDREFLGNIEEAISLYQGEFMPGYYSNWVIQRREELNQQYIQLVTLYTRLAIRLNTPEIALSRIQEALRDNRFNEQLTLSYLELCDVLDRYHDAIIFYRKYEKRLAEELQLRPSPVIRSMSESIQLKVYSNITTMEWIH